MSWSAGSLLGKKDALSRDKEVMCQTLGFFLRISEERLKILHGYDTFYNEDDACSFDHGPNKRLGADSKCVVSTTLFGKDVLSVSELYHYMRIAYQRFMSKDNPQAEKDEFTAGMQHFRDACKIKCDANGDPILEGYPHA